MFSGRRQPSCDGTSRMTRECHVRICERLGVKFPGPTRQRRTVLKVNEAKSAVARPQERKFLGFSFATGPEVKRTIAPKSLERFKQRIR